MNIHVIHDPSGESYKSVSSFLEGGKPEDPEEKTRVITTADQNKTNTQTPCSAGNAGYHVAIDFSFTFDWLRDWREFSRSVTDRSEAKPIQPWITFDTN